MENRWGMEQQRTRSRKQNVDHFVSDNSRWTGDSSAEVCRVRDKGHSQSYLSMWTANCSVQILRDNGLKPGNFLSGVLILVVFY